MLLTVESHSRDPKVPEVIVHGNSETELQKLQSRDTKEGSRAESASTALVIIKA